MDGGYWSNTVFEISLVDPVCWVYLDVMLLRGVSTFARYSSDYTSWIAAVRPPRIFRERPNTCSIIRSVQSPFIGWSVLCTACRPSTIYIWYNHRCYSVRHHIICTYNRTLLAWCKCPEAANGFRTFLQATKCASMYDCICSSWMKSLI